jgi:hypothetical protein
MSIFYEALIIILIQGIVNIITSVCAMLLFTYILSNILINKMNNGSFGFLMNSNQSNQTNHTKQPNPQSESLMTKLFNFGISMIFNKTPDNNNPIQKEKLKYIEDNNDSDTDSDTDSDINTNKKSESDDIDSNDIINNNIHEQIINNYNINNREFEENKNTDIIFEKSSCFGCFGNLFNFAKSDKTKNKKQK